MSTIDGLELLPAVAVPKVVETPLLERIRPHGDVLKDIWDLPRGIDDGEYCNAVALVMAQARLLPHEAKDLYEFLQTDWEQPPAVTLDEFGDYFDHAISRVGPERQDLPQIIVEPPEHTMTQAAVDSLRHTPNLFQRGGALCRISYGAPLPESAAYRDADIPSIEVVTGPMLVEILSHRAFWYKRTKDGLKDSFVPPVVVNLVLARGVWPVPKLIGVIESPTLRPNGTTITDKGLDASTGLYLTKQYTLPQLGIKEAKAALEYVVRDFPFKSDADRSAWFAYVLTPFARHMFHGPVPLWLFNANIKGSGKTMLCDVASVIVTGHDMMRMPIPPDDDEWRKRILSILLEGCSLVLFDNLTNGSTLASAALDAAITSTTWSDRKLSLNEMGKAPVLWTPAATGNNISLGGDLSRRTQLCQLESPLENPASRQDFAEPDLPGFVRKNRLTLVAACLTVLKHYMNDNQPDQRLTAFGSFQQWSDIVRSAIVYAGWPDPMEANQGLQGTDVDGDLLRSLIAAWNEADSDGHGMTIGEAIRRSRQCNEANEPCYPTLKNVLASLPPDRDMGRSLGQNLSKFSNRVMGGYKFTIRGKSHGSNVWWLESVNN